MVGQTVAAAARSDVTVVEVPQWRGSGAPTAERLREGAKLLADMMPATHRVRVEVDDDDLPETAARVRSAVSGAAGFVVTAGGDCGVELEPVAEAMRRHGDRLVVVWFDAHGDLNTPATSPSGAFHGMVLRALTGEGPAGLVADAPLDPRRIVLAAVRDLDPGEIAFIEATGIRRVTGPDPAALTEAIAAATPPGRSAAVYIHIDLDVLDPRAFAAVGSPAPGGLQPDQLLAMVEATANRFEVAGLGITEYEPSRPEDQALLASLVPSLVEACTAPRT
ncbi:arginase family protein [Nonomuraea sp. SMC257]|uniref:Arginase family protein n=1 Tax=Nonomuraea montanisoli TaxID=2741721 RepID=A0A7Y6IBZ2_9ACTN|nr:arginase family protein [Nonomuraea montanisoli]NUW35415.1 arginase family protein [Nonomuraea montanisoli]